MQSTKLAVYPNPATAGNIQLSFQSEAAGNYQIEITDVFGKTLQTKQVVAQENEYMNELVDIQSLASGMYLAILRSSTGKQVARFTVK
jgi:hypothetical protein